jgi:hypothetical protein
MIARVRGDQMKKCYAAALLFALACTAAGLQRESKPRSAPTERTVQSDTWKVTVLAAERYQQARPNLDPPVKAPARANLRVDLRFAYLGPTGKVAPPSVVVRNGRSKLETLENITYYTEAGAKDDYSIIAWLLSARKTKPTLRPVSTGQKFGLHSFYIADVPLERVTLELRFADAPAMNLDFKAQR